MSMRFVWIGLVFGFFMVSGVLTAQAEMYKYHDDQGNVCYTDNLAQIPEDQRPNAHTMEVISADDTAGQEAENINELKPEGQVESDDHADMVVDEETIAALNVRKKDLDSEFSGLMAEKYALLKEKEKLNGLAGRDVKARESYEGKVTDLNNRIADYKIRRGAFQKECEQVKQVLAPASSEDEGAEILTE